MYAATEQSIIDRLRAKLPANVHVGTLRDIDIAQEMRQKAPAAWVIYDGYSTGDVITPTHQVQQVQQDWFVVVSAKSAKGNGNVDAARDAVSDLCELVLKALLGYHVGGGRYLRLQPAPGPEYSAGYAFVPLAFSCAATFRGEQ